MTVSSTTNRKTFTGDGVTTSFGTSPVVFFASGDLDVYVVTTATGAATLLTENTHYTVTGGSGSTGTVSLAGGSAPYGAPSASQTLVIVRNLDITQETDFVNNEASDAEVAEDAIDRLTMIAQQLDARLDRSFTLSDSDVSGASLTIPTPVAGAVLAWNSSADALESYVLADLSAYAISPFAATLLDDTTAAAARTTLGAAASSDLAAYAPLASPTFTGDPKAPTPSPGDNDTSIATTAFVTAAIAANPSVLPLSLQDGGKLSNNASDATNDIDIAAALWSSDDTLAANRVQMLLSAMTKQLDAAWAVGTNQGMRDTGSIANGTWHIYAIKRTDTNVVDVLASLTPDRPAATVTMTIASPAVVSWTGHGLVAGASIQLTTTGALPTGVTAGTTYYVISTGLTADTFQFSATQGGAAVNTSGSQSGTHTCTPTPVMPANYTKKRRIGSILRESATIVPFVQDGDDFMRKSPVMDVNQTNPGTSAVSRTLSVPTGLRAKAQVQMIYLSGSGLEGSVYLSDLSQTDIQAANNAAPLANMTNDSQTIERGSGPLYVFTNYSAQIRSRQDNSDGGTVIRIATLGWSDARGRNA